MAECLLVMTDKGHLLPLDGSLSKMQPGEVIRVKYSFARNPKFHGKMFALFKFAFDAMPDPEPIDHRGLKVQPLKDFETSRKFLTVQAGFFDVIMLPNGEARLQAKSLSYANMDNEEFERVYSAVIDVVLSYLPDAYGFDSEKLDAAIDNLMRFA